MREQIRQSDSEVANLFGCSMAKPNNLIHKIFFRLFLLLCCALMGCFSNAYRGRPLQLCETDFASNVRETSSTSSVEPGNFCGERWWEFFEDEQLTKMIDLSLECHPSIKAAEAQILLACNKAMEVRSDLYPHAYLEGNLSRHKMSKLAVAPLPAPLPLQYTDTFFKLTNLVYELDIWKKNRARFYAALDKMKAQMAEWEETKLLLSVAIAHAYFDLQMTLARKKINQERLKAKKELYSLLKQQFDLGIIYEFFLYQTDSEVQHIEDLIYQLEGQAEIDKHALDALVGNTTGLCGLACRFDEAPSAKFHRPFPLPCTLSIDLLVRRPDITAQIWRIEEAGYYVYVAKTRFYPQIDLRGFVGLDTFKIAKLFTAKALTYLGQVAGLLPLFTAGELRAQLGVAREELEFEIQTYNELVLAAVQQTADAMTELVTADKRLSSATQSVSDAMALYALTEQRYTNGIDNKIAVLNALENFLVQEDLKAQVQLVRFESALDLIRAIGGGYFACD